MKNRVLFVATVASAIDNFNRDNIQTLQGLGYQVSVAANFEEGNSNSQEQLQCFIKEMTSCDVACFQVNFTRTITAISKHVKSYQRLCEILSGSAESINGVSQSGGFQFVHCHTPIGAALARLASRKLCTQCIYTAHGFHFYHGAPLKNWLCYYPAEWFLSYFTDILITINKEDFALAQEKLHAKKTFYIPGVGVDVRRFFPCAADEKKSLRRKYQIAENDIILISVGELCDNKNQSTIIEAIRDMSLIDRVNLKYIICGMGTNEEKYKQMITDYQLQDTIKLLGYRIDISTLYQLSDITVFPSYREGLPLAVMEAMASGLPVIGSNIRGVSDLIQPNQGGYLIAPGDIDNWGQTILFLKNHPEIRNRFGQYNRRLIQNYSNKVIQQKMKEIYEII